MRESTRYACVNAVPESTIWLYKFVLVELVGLYSATMPVPILNHDRVEDIQDATLPDLHGDIMTVLNAVIQNRRHM